MLLVPQHSPIPWSTTEVICRIPRNIPHVSARGDLSKPQSYGIGANTWWSPVLGGLILGKILLGTHHSLSSYCVPDALKWLFCKVAQTLEVDITLTWRWGNSLSKRLQDLELNTGLTGPCPPPTLAGFPMVTGSSRFSLSPSLLTSSLSPPHLPHPISTLFL